VDLVTYIPLVAKPYKTAALVPSEFEISQLASKLAVPEYNLEVGTHTVRVSNGKNKTAILLSCRTSAFVEVHGETCAVGNASVP